MFQKTVRWEDSVTVGKSNKYNFAFRKLVFVHQYSKFHLSKKKIKNVVYLILKHYVENVIFRLLYNEMTVFQLKKIELDIREGIP